MPVTGGTHEHVGQALGPWRYLPYAGVESTVNLSNHHPPTATTLGAQRQSDPCTVTRTSSCWLWRGKIIFSHVSSSLLPLNEGSYSEACNLECPRHPQISSSMWRRYIQIDRSAPRSSVGWCHFPDIRVKSESPAALAASMAGMGLHTVHSNISRVSLCFKPFQSQ